MVPIHITSIHVIFCLLCCPGQASDPCSIVVLYMYSLTTLIASLYWHWLHSDIPRLLSMTYVPLAFQCVYTISARIPYCGCSYI